MNNAYHKLTKTRKNKNMNKRALKYFLFIQSLLIDQIENPFINEIPDLSEMNFDFQYHIDNEIQFHEKINYLALFEFWKEYLCNFHQKSSKDLHQIHDDYMRLLMLLFPSENKKNKYLKPFEWINNN